MLTNDTSEQQVQAAVNAAKSAVTLEPVRSIKEPPVADLPSSSK